MIREGWLNQVARTVFTPFINFPRLEAQQKESKVDQSLSWILLVIPSLLTLAYDYRMRSQS